MGEQSMMESSMAESSMMESSMSGTESGGQPPQSQQDNDFRNRVIAIVIVACLVIVLVLFLLFSFVLGGSESSDESGGETVPGVYVPGPPAPPPRPPTKPTTTTTTYRPRNPKYVKKNIVGLLCHTNFTSYLGSALPPACDFYIVDVNVDARPHPVYSPYMADVALVPGDLTAKITKKVAKAPGKGVILVVERNTIRQYGGDPRPQAVLRGILQIVTNINIDGIGLSDIKLQEKAVDEVKDDTAILSDELRTDYHGLYWHGTYTGSHNHFKDLISKVAALPAVFFVYRVTGRTALFTAPYFSNYYLKKGKIEPLSAHIKRDVVDTLAGVKGRKAVALSFALLDRVCEKNTVRSISPTATPKCHEQDSNTSSVCILSPVRVQGHFYSLMNRRPTFEDDSIDITTDWFFEIEATVSAKAYLMLEQLKKAGVAPITFIIERYELELQKKFTFYKPNDNDESSCDAEELGITKDTKAAISKIL